MEAVGELPGSGLVRCFLWSRKVFPGHAGSSQAWPGTGGRAPGGTRRLLGADVSRLRMIPQTQSGNLPWVLFLDVSPPVCPLGLLGQRSRTGSAGRDACDSGGFTAIGFSGNSVRSVMGGMSQKPGCREAGWGHVTVPFTWGHPRTGPARSCAVTGTHAWARSDLEGGQAFESELRCR